MHPLFVMIKSKVLLKDSGKYGKEKRTDHGKNIGLNQRRSNKSI